MSLIQELRGVDFSYAFWHSGLVESEGGRSIQAFNFSLLDTLLDRLRALGLRPGLELMGNPFSRPLDFERPDDLALWKELVEALARNYIGAHAQALANLLALARKR